jgi:DNA invertase Pin-like site-specific DNA recombinase
MPIQKNIEYQNTLKKYNKVKKDVVRLKMNAVSKRNQKIYNELQLSTSVRTIAKMVGLSHTAVYNIINKAER